MEIRTNVRAFYGNSLTSQNYEEFVITERQYPAGYLTPLHVHERSLFCVVLDGAYQEKHCSRTVYCTRATTLFHAAEQEHQEQFSNIGARSLIVEIAPAWMNRVGEISKASIRNSSARDNGVVRPMGSRLYREFLTGDPASRLIIEGLLFELTGEFFRAETRRDGQVPAWLSRAVDMIQDNFPRRLTLTAIADEVGVHPVHLAQSFRRFHACTIGDYVRRIRIDYACRELVRSEMPLASVALAAGFTDRDHFARTFKKAVGVAPSQYRTNARGDTFQKRTPAKRAAEPSGPAADRTAGEGLLKK